MIYPSDVTPTQPVMLINPKPGRVNRLIKPETSFLKNNPSFDITNTSTNGSKGTVGDSPE